MKSKEHETRYAAAEAGIISWADVEGDSALADASVHMVEILMSRGILALAAAPVPDAVLSIARRMVEESKDNDHCTAHPVFIVQKHRLVTGIDTEYTDNIAWISEDEILDAEESSALEAAYQDTGEVPDGYTRTGYCEEWEHIDAYLTERAAQSRCSGDPDYRVMVESAYRNKEMQIVRAFLMSLAASKQEK